MATVKREEFDLVSDQSEPTDNASEPDQLLDEKPLMYEESLMLTTCPMCPYVSDNSTTLQVHIEEHFTSQVLL